MYPYQILSFFLYLFLSAPLCMGQESWMQARSLEQLQKMVHQKEIKDQAEMNCLWQLKTKKIPTYCYTWLIYQKSSDKQAILNYLDEKCQQGVALLTTLTPFQQLLSTPHLSVYCQKQLINKKNILEYQLRDKPVQEILKWHVPKVSSSKAL